MNRTTSLLAGLILALATSLNAETVTMVGQQGAADNSISVPSSGLTMATVTEQFGDPNRKGAPVGEPPITRWVYERFTVYFENDRVIHSVRHPLK